MIVTGKKQAGFTLIELIVVLLIISVLAGIVSPVVVSSLDRARESALKENLYIMRKTLDDYYADRGNYPSSLEQLVDEDYMRSIPDDPFLKNNESWVLSYDDEGGISDVHSAYDEVANDGSYYRDW
ncbi:MAG: prepilin-type N-terminal cleavage/methylation domain-containing protein [Gammaproteobacteria bacterium]|nr:prepilin-type N-terminal cleavage/methylation domain-containing protein [Gammaproteobacteria bacterium]